MRAFRARSRRYVARLDDIERDLIGQLAADVAELLGATAAQLAAAQGGAGEGGSGEGGSGGGGLGEGGSGDGTPGGAASARDEADDGEPWDLPPLGGLDHVLAGVSDTTGPGVPEDPAVRRLLPVASEDAEIAEEFRRFTQVDLRAHKIERLLALVRALRSGAEKGRLAVPKDRADLLAGALVDIRLVIAERLGLDSDESADELYTELARAERGDGPDSAAAALRLHLATAYAALTWLQESLVTVQLADLDGPDA